MRLAKGTRSPGLPTPGRLAPCTSQPDARAVHSTAKRATLMACADSMSEPDASHELEAALQQTEGDAEAGLKAAAAVTKSLKRFRQLVHEGNLRDVGAALSAVDQGVAALREQVTTTAERWAFDETSYFATGAYTRELLETATRMGLPMFEQDDRLYCYPSLLRVLPA